MKQRTERLLTLNLIPVVAWVIERGWIQQAWRRARRALKGKKETEPCKEEAEG